MDISLKTGICHLRCVKAAPDNQTAGGALQPSLFCNMPRFLGQFVFLCEKFFISASLKAAVSAPLCSLVNSCQVRPRWGRGELLQKSALVEFVGKISVVTWTIFYTKVYLYRKFLLICQYENKHSL